MKSGKVVLIIQDGWGIAENPGVSAIQSANTPFYDKSLNSRSNTRLEASGNAVGLPKGQMGNSEVGHMNIGAGRIVFQDLVRINHEIKSGDFAKNQTFLELLSYCKANKKPLHLLGLLSDGGVHSSIEHLKGIISVLAQENLVGVYVHVFTDGRDTAPNGGIQYVADLEAHMEKEKCGQIATVLGRYYAMDRDKRWERVQIAYDLMVKGKGKSFPSAKAAIEHAYAADITDEFVEASVIEKDDQAIAKIADGDGLLFYNFRTDRGRQLTTVLTQEDMPDFGMKTLDLHYVTMTRYDDKFKNIHVLYEKDNINNGLGEFLSNEGKTQIRIAETEKYPHVTFFFNGGREAKMPGEEYIICPSPKVATYDLKPEMSAFDIRDKIIAEIEKGKVDFVCLNFANPDMVGHTGVFDAAVKACETVDACSEAIVKVALDKGYKVLLTSDHGNSDKMRNADGSAHTAHTTALVPLILFDPEETYSLKQGIGKLGDLAPSILTLMGLSIPTEMSGDILIEKSGE